MSDYKTLIWCLVVPILIIVVAYLYAKWCDNKNNKQKQ